MEITDNQEGSVDLSIQDIFGWAYVPKDNFLSAMRVMRLEPTHGWHTAIIYFRGEYYGLHVEVVATRVYQKGDRWQYTNKDEQYTHFKIKGYVPESVHITGKGRDKQAWNIYRTVTATLEKAIGEHYKPVVIETKPVQKKPVVKKDVKHRYSHVNRGQFRDMGKIVPNWEKLPPLMVRRYLEWKTYCDTRWEDEYQVSVTVVHNGNNRQYAFKFEVRAHAVSCEQWWRELGYRPVLKVL